MSTRVGPIDRLVTADEMLTLSGDDLLHELVRGEHYVNPPPGAQHGKIGITIIGLLLRHIGDGRPGEVFGPDTGFLLSRDPDTVRAPDVSFVRRERIPPGGVPVGYLEGAPDLAVEVLSPSDTMIEVDEKIGEYLATGARQVWIVNPKRRTVTVHSPGAQPRVLVDGDRLDAYDAVPGFACDVREIMI